MSNKTALITGGATGIGKEAAKKLLAKGVNVVISGRRADVGAQAAQELAAFAKDGAKVKFVQNDVTDEAGVKALIDGIVAEFGALDYAVNNAAVSLETGLLPQSDSEVYKNMLQINVLGVYYCMKHEIAQMQKQGRRRDCEPVFHRGLERHSLRQHLCFHQTRGGRLHQILRP